MSKDVKCDFQTYIRRYTSPNENFEYGYPHSNVLLQFELKLEHSKPHKASCHPMKCDIVNDIKLQVNLVMSNLPISNTQPMSK